MTESSSKSQFEKNAETPPRKLPYEHWQEIFTGNDSGKSDNSERIKEFVAEAINEKLARRYSK